MPAKTPIFKDVFMSFTRQDRMSFPGEFQDFPEISQMFHPRSSDQALTFLSDQK